jgi:hypothetical protein
VPNVNSLAALGEVVVLASNFTVSLLFLDHTSKPAGMCVCADILAHLSVVTGEIGAGLLDDRHLSVLARAP